MKINLLTWILAGALAASLQWNLRRAAPERADKPTSATGSLVLDDLDLTPVQSRELERLMKQNCSAAAANQQRAEESLVLLRTELAAAHPDPARLGKLIEEISDLRRQSLSACVQAIAGVREVLTPAQLEAVLKRCCPAPGCASDCGR